VAKRCDRLIDAAGGLMFLPEHELLQVDRVVGWRGGGAGGHGGHSRLGIG
jgi:hypothetical protein